MYENICNMSVFEIRYIADQYACTYSRSILDLL